MTAKAKAVFLLMSVCCDSQSQGSVFAEVSVL